MTNTSTADTMNLRELNPEELNSVSGGLSWDDFREGVRSSSRRRSTQNRSCGPDPISRKPPH